MTPSEHSYSLHPMLAGRNGALAIRVDKVLDMASRVNGEPNYSREKLWTAWVIAGMALVDDLDVDPQELVDEAVRSQRRLEGSRS